MRQKSARLRVGVSYICPIFASHLATLPPGAEILCGTNEPLGTLATTAHVCNVTQKNRQGTSAVYYEASLIVLNI